MNALRTALRIQLLWNVNVNVFNFDIKISSFLVHRHEIGSNPKKKTRAVLLCVRFSSIVVIASGSHTSHILAMCGARWAERKSHVFRIYSTDLLIFFFHSSFYSIHNNLSENGNIYFKIVIDTREEKKHLNDQTENELCALDEFISHLMVLSKKNGKNAGRDLCNISVVWCVRSDNLEE